MKTKKLAFAAAAAATLVLGACGNNNDSSGSTESDEIVTELSEDTTVTFWHAMNGAQEESLTKLTEQFMDENPNIKIELQNQSSYPDLQAKVNSTLPSPKDLPTFSFDPQLNRKLSQSNVGHSLGWSADCSNTVCHNHRD